MEGVTTKLNPTAYLKHQQAAMAATDSNRDAKESLEIAFEISNILETGLDRHTLSILIALIERGVNPEALAAVVRELSQPYPMTSSISIGSNPFNPR